MDEELLTKIREHNGLSKELEESLIRKYEYRGRKAVEFLKGGNVYKMDDEFFVKGDRGLYRVLLEEDECNCSAVFRRLEGTSSEPVDKERRKPGFQKKNKECSHILAAKIAEATGNFREISSESELDKYL